ncbi:hypothetical protein KJ359_002285 [Pestalotiopsis sp. 9143b]|nr:hypothetical protein KJ359_002285 [Pestalotiopsis sp. 9143b]
MLDLKIGSEKDDHDEWQKNRTKLRNQQRPTTRRALPPPTDHSKIMSWRKMALWRAQKLGLAGVRHKHGLLLGSVKAAAAQITMLEFGLDIAKGGHNSTLLEQLLLISPEHGQWQEFMEMSARVEMITDGVLDKPPKDIPWFPRDLLEVELVRHHKRGENLHEITIRDKYDYKYFTRPGEYFNVKINIINYNGRSHGCLPDQPYQHRDPDA